MKIGLEIHASLPTQTKLFCSCRARDESEGPNSNICPVCMGFPGSKPVLNGKALEIATRIAKVLNAKVSDTVSFVRKIYFYPDLPKSYQITQLHEAIGYGGHVDIENGKSIGITRIQLEEDPAKIIREDGYTLLDFNRSGRPLVEIVTDPDMKSEEDLKEFMTELRSMLYYIGVDVNEEIKADLNVSVEGGDRVEVKNVTGLKNLIDALKFEVNRQTGLVDAGKQVKRETRSYDAAKMITVASREKETDEEYGFIYEADLTDYALPKLDERYVTPRLVAEEYSKKYKVNEKTMKELVMFSRESLGLIERNKDRHDMKSIINAIEVLKKYDRLGISDSGFERLVKAVESGVLIDDKLLSRIERGEKLEGFKKVDEREIDGAIRKMVEDNSQLLNEYSKNNKVFNFIVGKISKGYNVDPRYVSERLHATLKKLLKN